MTLALISGRGDLPARVVAALAEKPLIVGYEGALPDGLEADVTFRLETLGSLLVKLGEHGVTQVCFCGGIDRPQIDPSLLDAETMPLVPLFQKALKDGDDGALRVVKQLFEDTGFAVVGADELAPDLVAPPGVHSEKWPDAQMRHDAAKAEAVVAALAPLDVGQGCVVGDGQVLGIETIGGTDHMLATLPKGAQQRGAILYKGPKPGQLTQIDMPTIGPETIRAAQKAGLAGVVVDAGDVIVLDPARCTQLADEYQMVFWARRGGEDS